MDADLQDFPEEIPELYEMLQSENADIISGWKQNRQDPKLTKSSFQTLQLSRKKSFRFGIA